jgi:hypothetical protein
MARLATKSPAEREDEEVTRLVRPAPKKKPPRRDRRREQMDTDTDSDADLSGKDTSLNYKVIGGSTLQRLVARYFVRKAAEPPPGSAPPRPRKPGEKIPARSKATGEKVYITRETLKAEPQKYEKWTLKKKDEEGAPGAVGPDAPKPVEAPGAPAPSEPQKVPDGAVPAAGGEPAEPAPEEPKKKKPKKPKSKPAEGEKEDGAAPPKAKEPKPDPEPSAAQKHGIQPPKQREVTATERNEAALFLVDSLPPKLAAKLIAEGIHPDDAKTLVNNYQAAKSRPLGNPSEAAARAAKIFQTNPDKVEPPKTWRKDGEKVDFATLSPEEKASAYREHQMQVVAMSMAVQHQLEEKLGFGGAVPHEVSHTLTRALLGGIGDEEKSKVAGAVFESTAASRGYQKISDGLAERMMKAVDGNPEATTVLRSYLEANDYKQAKSIYLGATGLSEGSSPSEIVDGLRAARDFFTVRARAYGDVDGHEGAKRFETKTLARLRELEPDKYATIRRKIDVEDAREYDRAKKPWDAYDKQLEAWDDAEEYDYGSKVRKKKPTPPPGERPVEPFGYGNARSSKSLSADGRQLWDDLFERSGTKKSAARTATKYLLSSYLSGIPMDQERQKRALYHGIEPAVHYPRLPYPRGEQVPARALAETDLTAILSAARSWVQQGSTPEQALEMAVRSGPYTVDIQTFGELVRRLQGASRSATRSSFASAHDINLRESDNGVRHMLRLSSEQKGAANQILGQLDALSQSITSHRQKWGMSFEAAKKLVNHLDRIADSTEALVFGQDSLRNRQAEVALLDDGLRADLLDNGLVTASQMSKAAKVLQRDSDEPYMDTFKNPMSPIETDSDEPYMSAYGDDQSSAVNDGEDDTGRELAP